MLFETGKQSWIYSTDAFEIQLSDHSCRRRGPCPGDVYTTTKHPAQNLLCIDNSIRLSPSGKRECSVLGITSAGRLLLSPPTTATVVGTRQQFPCFGHITPEHVTVSLQEHCSQAEKHLLRTMRPPAADAVEHPNAQVPLYPFQLVRTEALFSLHSLCSTRYSHL